VGKVPFFRCHQAVVNSRQRRARQRETQQGNQYPGQMVILSVHPYAFDAPPAQRGNDGVRPGPQVAPAIQVQAVQAKLATDESQPGGDCFIFLREGMHAVDYEAGCAGGAFVRPVPGGFCMRFRGCPKGEIPDAFELQAVQFNTASYNRRLCSISLAGWPCRVSQALQEYLGYFYPATQG